MCSTFRQNKRRWVYESNLNVHKKIFAVCLAGCNFSLSGDRCTGSCPHQIRFWSTIHRKSLPLFKPIQTWITQIISVYYIDSWHVDPSVCSPSPAYSPGLCHTKPHHILPCDWLMMMQWCMIEEAAWFKTHAGDRFASIISITSITLTKIE